MARARNIKPALFKNEILGVADPMLTLLFEGLWLLADRAGRLEDRPLRIKGELFPYREGLDMESLLGWLAENGFIVRYQVDGKRYIEIDNFVKHQNPHRNEPESEIPSASNGCTTSDFGRSASEEIGSAPADSLSLDSLIPDSLIPDPLQEPCAPSAHAPAADDLFAKFWKLYPRKQDKAKALKAFAKLKVTDDLFNLIAKGLAAQAASHDWLKDGGKFVPMPTTWLNGKRWEDEVKPAGNVHTFPGLSRHTGLAERFVIEDQREDGTHAF